MKKPGRNDECWCGSGRKYKKCHIDFDERIEEIEAEGHIVPDHSIIKTAEQIEKIKESAKINIAVLDYVAEHIKAGISTAEIDRWVYDITTKMGGIPAPLALSEGLKEVKPWNFLGDMGQAVNDFVKSKGYSVVREVGGHGIGLEFHEDPWVSYVSEKGTEMLMVPGMIFTIEPMINMGKPAIYTDEENGWTIYTKDGTPSAQWEIQVLVTEDGYEIISY